MKYRSILFLILGIDVLVLFLQTSELSISYLEASILYGDISFLQVLMNIFLSLFGENDFALRLPMIIMHIISIVLLYLISKKHVKYERDRLWIIFIFTLLPGVISSSIIVNSAGVIIFGLLLFVYLYENFSIKFSYLLLLLYSFIDSGFVYLFIALVAYGFHIKKNRFALFNIVMLAVSTFMYGFNAHGLPKGHFLDTLGLYAAIFTPIVFIYLFYVLYRRFLTKEINLLWFIASVSLFISLLLSFRQKIEVEIFAPYLIIALPLAAQTFSSSYRVRLKLFRTKYRTVFILSLIFLFLNSFLVIFNKELYMLLDNPKKHFAYKMHIAKELAQELKERDIYCVDTSHRMSMRLRFYGIQKCENYILSKYYSQVNSDIVTISYNSRDVYKASVTKINTK